MILSPNRTIATSAADFQLNYFLSEIFESFKLSGCTIYNKLHFKFYYNSLKKNFLLKLKPLLKLLQIVYYVEIPKSF